METLKNLMKELATEMSSNANTGLTEDNTEQMMS